MTSVLKTYKEEDYYVSPILTSVKVFMQKSKRGDFYLYFMDNGQAIKIGLSKNPENRRRTIQTGSHLKVEILRTIPVAYYNFLARNVERRAHKFFTKYRIRGEWFSREILDQVYDYTPTKTYLTAKHDFARKNKNV